MMFKDKYNPTRQMKKYLIFLVAILACSLTDGKAADDSDWGIKLSGFVNSDFFWDSRQNVCLREGHFMLWPAPEKLDPNNEDINARANFNMLSIRSRLRGSISGPDVLGATTSAVLEGAFFGHHNSDLNGLRLRHAFVRLNWENTELIAGQYWNPAFIN